MNFPSSTALATYTPSFGIFIHFVVFSNFPCDFFFAPLIGYLGACCLISAYLWVSQIAFSSVFTFHSIVFREYTLYYFSLLKSMEVCFMAWNMVSPKEWSMCT